MKLPICLALCCLSLGAASVASAQTGIRVNKRAVDSVALKSGGRILGAVLTRGMNGTITMAVQRAWLQGNSAALYARATRDERQRIASAPRKKLQRIRDWIKERAAEKRLLPFLKAELKRMEKTVRIDESKKTASPKTQFMLVTIPANEIRGGFRQPAHHRRIALLAWTARLKNVETRSTVSLMKELRPAGNEARAKPVDLSSRLPKTNLETERQWAARQAIVEFDYLKRVRFQGTGDVLVQAGGDAAKAADIGTLFGSIYKSQLNDLLEEALGNGRVSRRSKQKKWNDAIQKAAKTAESEKVRGFRITRVQPDLSRKQVTVEEHFVAKMQNGSWQIVWTHREQLDASKPSKDLEKRIKDDARVKQALKLVKGLGLGVNDAQIATAMRFGAATQLATEKAGEKFDEFRNTYSRKLDIEPIGAKK